MSCAAPRLQCELSLQSDKKHAREASTIHSTKFTLQAPSSRRIAACMSACLTIKRVQAQLRTSAFRMCEAFSARLQTDGRCGRNLLYCTVSAQDRPSSAKVDDTPSALA